MKFVYLRKRIQIPIYPIEEEVTYEVNTITTIENDEKSDDEILDNPFNYSARDEVLINITEENVKKDVSPTVATSYNELFVLEGLVQYRVSSIYNTYVIYRTVRYKKLTNKITST